MEEETSPSKEFLKIIKEQQHIFAEETKFIDDTSTALHESMIASFTNLVESLSDLFETTHTLGKKLNNDIDNTINKYETKRLKSFGRFRINLDANLRSVKEDIIRSLRSKLGFTPAGDPIFKESSEIPSPPSAVYIADMFANTRKLISRGLKKVENELKNTIESKKTEYTNSINQLLDESDNKLKQHSCKHKNDLLKQSDMFSTLLNRYANQLSVVDESINLFYTKLSSDLSLLLEEQFTKFEVSMKEILLNHQSIENEITKETIQSIKEFSESLDFAFEELKSEINAKKIDTVTGLISSEVESYNKGATQIQNLFKADLKNTHNFSVHMQKQKERLKETNKKLQKTFSSLEKEANKKDNPDNTTKTLIRELEQSIIKSSIVIDSIDERIDSFSSSQSQYFTQRENRLKKQEKQLKQLLSKEKELNQIIGDMFFTELDNFFEKIRNSFTQKIQQFGLDITDISFDFETKLEELNTKTLKEIEDDLLKAYNKIEEDLNQRKGEWKEKNKQYSHELKKHREQLQQEIKSIIEKNDKTVEEQRTIIREKMEKLVNSMQIDLTHLFHETKTFNEEITISIINLINNLEMKLGDEYEVILEYFEKTKETTLGTTKTLLDDLSSLMKTTVDSIWTTVLKEFNTLQELTNSSNLARRSKNIIHEVSVKIDKSIEERNKEAKELIEIISSSIKVAFSELKKRLEEDNINLKNRIEEIK